MSLNTYRDEAGRFLEAILASDEPEEAKIAILEHELAALKANLHDNTTVSHQVYDLLFMLFEIAAQYNIDLDSEWLSAQMRKKAKYL